MPFSARRWPRFRGEAAFALMLVGVVALMQPFSSAQSSTDQPPRDSISALNEWMSARQTAGKRVPGWVKGYEYWYRQRAFPNDRIDWKAMQRAQAHADKMPRATRIGSRSGSAREVPNERWELAGPRNLGIPYRTFYGVGPLAGRINALAFDQSRPNVYWAASGQGGVWKSADFGSRWSCKSDDPLFRNQRIGTITVDPTNSDVIYVGTGDFSWGNSTYGFGILKSSNGGDTWQLLGSTVFSGTSIRKIRVLPEEPNSILVTTGQGQFPYGGKVYLSTDGGVVWNVVIDTAADWGDNVASARFNGGAGARFYYACGNSPNGGQVWRSGDNCRTWTKLNPPLSRNAMGNLIRQDSLDLAVSPVNEGTVYLLSGSDRAIYKSTDSGADGSWTNTTNNFPNGTNNYNWSQHTYDYHITCSRDTELNNDVVYVGLIDLVASFNGGTSWTSVGKTYTNGALTHNDQHALVADPRDPNHLLVGNDGGVYDLQMDPGIGEWNFTSLNTDLPITQFYHAAYHPTDPQRMLGGTQDNASPVANGDLFNWPNRGGGDGGFSTFDTVNPNIQYTNSQPATIRDASNNVIGQQFNFYRTTDGWASTPGLIATPTVADNIGFINPLAIAPSNPRFVYKAGTYLYQWDTQTSTLTRLGGASPPRLCAASSFIRYIAVAPNNASVIYTGANDGSVWMTTDAGGTWRQVDSNLPSRAVTSIAVHPTNANDVLVSLSGTGAAHVWRCADITATPPVWTQAVGSGLTGLSNDDPVNSIARDSAAPDKVWFVGADTGLKFTFDGGATWYDGGSAIGLPRVQVNHVQSVPGTGYLMAATWGRGIWRIKLSDAGGAGDIYEPDSTAGVTREIDAPVEETHSLHIPTDVDWTKTDLTEPSNLLVSAARQTGPGAIRLRVHSYNPANGNLTTLADLTHSSGSALYIGEQLAAGTYYFEVLEDGQNAPVGEYVLNMLVAVGDSYEPDNSITEFTPITLPSTTAHNFHAADDGDWVRFTVPAGGTVAIETFDLQGECDTVVQFLNTDGSVIDEDDDDGEGLGSRIVWTVGTGGTFFARARPFNAARGSYKLRVQVPVPEAPADFEVRVISETRADLEFRDSTAYESGYELQRRLGTGTWGVVAPFPPTTGTYTYQDTNLTAGATYGYRIRAYNNNGESFSPIKQITTPGGGPPAPPANVVAFGLSDKSLAIVISDGSANETQFEAQISTNGRRWTSLPKVDGRPGTGSAVIVIAPNLTAETTYYYRARSLNAQSGSGYTPTPARKAKTLKKGKTAFNVSPTLTINGSLGSDTTKSMLIPNPLGLPVQLNVPQIASPFSASPTGNPLTLGPSGQTFTVTFRPTSRTTVQKTWTINSVPAGAFSIKIKVVGKVQ